MNQSNWKNKWRHFSSNYGYWLSFVLLFIVFSIVSVVKNNQMLNWNIISNQFVQAAIIGIASMGMGMVITAGMIDLSSGSLIALNAGLTVLVLNATHNIWLTLLFSLAFGLVLGAINGILIAKGQIAPFIVTLATMSAYRSIITQLGQSGPFTIDQTMYEPFRMIAAGNIGPFPNLMLIFIAVSILVWVIMSKTKFGRYIYAVGSNEQAARLTGIHVDRVKIAIFSVVGVLLGLASFLLVSRLTAVQAANAGEGFEMDAIAAVAIGGTSMDGGRGKVIGTFLGVLMLRIIQSILIMAQVPPFLNGLVRGVIIIIAVLAQSRRKAD